MIDFNELSEKYKKPFREKAPDELKDIVDAAEFLYDPLGLATGKIKDPTVKTPEERRLEQEVKAKQEEAGKMYDDLTVPQGMEEYDMPSTLEYGDDYAAGQLAGQYQQGDSKFGDIEVDPRYAESQMAALSGIEDIVNSEGLTDIDKANLARIESQVGRADRGRREAIQDRMRRQGMAGSGLDMLAQLQSNQAATDRQSQTGLDTAAMGMQRKDTAMRDLGTMSTSMRGQDWGEQAQAAAAQDAIDRFNTGNTMQRDIFNVGESNQAGMFNTRRSDDEARTNWGARENVRSANTDVRNDNIRNEFNDNITIRDKKSNARLGHANYQQGQADRRAGSRNQMIQGGVGLANTGLQTYMASDEDLKTNTTPLSEADLESFLESVKPKKYRYKDKKEGAGQRVGFIAQDIENNPIGEAIVQEDNQGTKRIDNFNLMGALLDSVSHLHKKQKKLEDELPETESKPVMIWGSD